MADPRISEDSVLHLARLVNEAEDMKDAANAALKDTWGDYREELKTLGLTGKEVSAEVAQIKAAIAATRLSQADKDRAETKAEGVDSYLAILASPRARVREAAE